MPTNKDSTITFRMTSEQKEQILKCAAAKNVNVSQYILDKVFHDETLEKIKKLKSALCEKRFNSESTDINAYFSDFLKINECIKTIDFILDNYQKIE